MNLDGRQLELLHEALIEAFPDRDKLKMFIRFRLGIQLDVVAKASDLQITVFEVLNRFEAEGRLVQLLRQACREARTNGKLRELEKQLLPAFTAEQLEMLEERVGVLSLTTSRLEELAARSAPRGWYPPLASDNESAQMAFSRLIDFLSSAHKQTSGEYPLHVFVQHLASDEMGAPASMQLRVWIQQTGGSISLASAALREPRLPHALHLFMKCESDATGPATPESEVRVTAWLWQLDDHLQTLSKIPERVLDSTPCRLREVPKLLSQIRKQRKVIELLRKTRERLTVEVCLRVDLLSEDIGNWNITVGRTVEPLVETYPVVVRSFERLYEFERQDTWGRWEERWEKLKSLGETAGESAVGWIEPTVNMNDRHALPRRPHVLCIASSERCTQEILDRGIDAGTPAMVWIRMDDVSAQQAKDVLAPLLRGPLSKLPKRIHEARQPGAGGQIAKHITLLWDDFDRIPPDAEDSAVYSAPTTA